MRFIVLGLSHNTAPLELRERFAQNEVALEKTLPALRALDFVDECCVLSTCNRVEYYVVGPSEPVALARHLRGYLQTFAAVPPDELEPHLYQKEGSAALEHLFRVASSLDSMVLGEPQILGQVKAAYRLATKLGTTGPTLTRAFERAFVAAKRVRSETGIAEAAVSMSFAAVELGREIFDSLEGKQVLLLGAGKMATLAARHLMAYGVSEVRVVSRTIEAAQKLASSIGGLASSLADLPMLLGQADIVICSTAATTHVVDKKMMARIMRERRYRAILFVDIAVPRDVHPSVSELDNVFVYDVDDLRGVLAGNRQARAKEAEAAARIVADEVDACLRSTRAREVVPLIKVVRAFALEIARGEAERTLSKLGPHDERTAKSVEAMAQAIVNKVLHPVVTRLKKEGETGDPEHLVEALVALFDIPRERLRDPDTAVRSTGDLIDAGNVLPFPKKSSDSGS